MTLRPLILALSLAGATAFAHAGTPQQDQYNAQIKQAAQRYAQDRSICNDETNPGHKMQCMRAAKEENTKAIAAAKAELKAASGGARNGKMACLDCGKVIGVRQVKKDGEGNAAGMLAGGAAGALLGHQVGGGTGKTLATVAGAVGGAYAGKKIQEKATAKEVWVVDVQYDNGNKASFEFEQNPNLVAGDRVRPNGNSVSRY